MVDFVVQGERHVFFFAGKLVEFSIVWNSDREISAAGIIYYVCERSRRKPVDEEDTKLGRWGSFQLNWNIYSIHTRHTYTYEEHTHDTWIDSLDLLIYDTLYIYIIFFTLCFGKSLALHLPCHRTLHPTSNSQEPRGGVSVSFAFRRRRTNSRDSNRNSGAVTNVQISLVARFAILRWIFMKTQCRFAIESPVKFSKE